MIFLHCGRPESGTTAREGGRTATSHAAPTNPTNVLPRCVRLVTPRSGDYGYRYFARPCCSVPCVRAAMSPERTHPDAPGSPHPSATARLADATTRGILKTLGEAGERALTSAMIADQHPQMPTQRLVRDRLRELERGGIVQVIDQPTTAKSGSELFWRLTTPGMELYRLGSLIARIVLQAMGIEATARAETRERIVQTTLSAMADPQTLRVGRVLASATTPLDPGELEALCAPLPRRTLYRRLSLLVDAGVVSRETTREVPRRTRYQLVERWRPVAGALLLSAWWELRHDQAEKRGRSIDLSGLLSVALPTVRLKESHRTGRLRWQVTDATGIVSEVDVEAADGALRLPAIDGAPNATAAGTPRAWATALVTDHVEDLDISGDADLVHDVLGALRAAALRYLR